MLGIFDSGLGGLTVLRRVRAELPGEELLFYADQANVPYGDKTIVELRSYLAASIAYLQGQKVDAVVMGCNTSCAVAARFGYPPTQVPILDLIDAAAHAVVAAGVVRVGILATVATVRLGAYASAIHRLAPHIDVQEIAAPALVPLVEAGHRGGPIARAAVAQACAGFTGDLDAVVLACTHYPLLDSEFAAVLGEGVRRIDPSLAQAARAVAWVQRRGTTRNLRAGRTRYVTSGDLAAFRANVSAIVGASEDVEQAKDDVGREPAQQGSGDDLQCRVSFEVHP